jgi:aquaporin related protein
MRDRVRNALVIVLGEFCGTFMFLLLSFIGAQTALVTNSPSDPTSPLLPFSLMYIAASFGTALAVNVWIFYRVSGGMFNPAVTVGLVLVGAVTPLHALAIIPTQLVAAIAAAGITDALLPGPLLVTNALGNGTSVAQGVFIEMFLTAQLVLTVYFLAVEKHRSTHLAPIGIGISVFIAHICATNWTGTSINPARSFGPSVIAGFHGYDWIYYIGPFLGSFLAFGCYKIFKVLEYQTANPGQDDDDLERAGRHHFFHHGKEPVSHTHTDTIEPKDHGVPQRNDSVIDGQMAPV